MDINSLFSSMFSGFGNKTPYGPQQPAASNPLLDYMKSMQPSTGQSIASALPFLTLPSQQNANLQPYQNTIDAIGNTNNPQYQNIYNQQRQQGQDNLAQQIMQLSNANRKLSSLGRTPLFDPERGGEQLFRGMTQGYQDVQNQAANNARSILGAQAQGQLNVGQLKNQTASNQAGIYGNLAGGLAKLFGL